MIGLTQSFLEFFSTYLVCFKIFDIDRDGVLSHIETVQMINVLLFVAKENKNSIIYKDLTKQEVINDLLTFTARKCNQTENGTESEEVLK